MKKLFSIILLSVFTICNSQIENPYQPYEIPKQEWRYKEAAITLGFSLASIALDAMGDAYLDMGKQTGIEGYMERGHMLSALSVGTLLARPFVSDMKRSDWGWYTSSYILLRVGCFDPIYNATRGLPLGYTGTTSYWDHFWGRTPKSWKLAYQSLYFTVGIIIPIQEL